MKLDHMTRQKLEQLSDFTGQEEKEIVKEAIDERHKELSQQMVMQQMAQEEEEPAEEEVDTDEEE